MTASEELKFLSVKTPPGGQNAFYASIKNGKDHEIVYVPWKESDRLRDYATHHREHMSDRIYLITYQAAGAMVAKAGKTIIR